MSGVIIRCPNCGTTQGALGECEACHEADTRYFCTNHAPGRWLDGAVCDACGATVGSARTVDRPPPRPTPRPRPTPALGRRPMPPTPPDEPGREREPEIIFGGARSGPVRDPERDPERVVLEEIGGLDPRRGWPAEPFPIENVRIVTASGCVRRLVLAFVILLALAALAFFGLLGVGARLLFGAALPL
jgi:hypothetical protein